MNKKLFILVPILCSIQIYSTPEQPQQKQPPFTTSSKEPKLTGSIEQPEFKDPVHLFKKRDFEQEINLKEQLKTEFPDESLVLKICTALKRLVTGETITQTLKGPQIPEIGYHPVRKIIYTDKLTVPTHIVLTFSSTNTLQEAVANLQQFRTAHNFLIDRDGSIHPVTAEGETVEDALKHRAFSVGESGKVIDGEYEERDMNAVSVSISVVGVDTEKATKEQETAVILLTRWLKEKFKVKAYNVVDYGTIALAHNANTDLLYGRRNTQENLPWAKLAEQGLTIWPKEKSNSAQSFIWSLKHVRFFSQKKSSTPDSSTQNIDASVPNNSHYFIWTSAALRKLGYITPVVTNKNNALFQQALITFQKHYQCTHTNGEITDETIAKLVDLLKQMEAINPNLKNIFPSSFLKK